MLKGVLKVGGFTMLSRLLGFVRDILIAAWLGTKTPAAEAWVAAFRFPNMFRRVFGEGAFNSAFVPLFASELQQKGEAEALEFANRAFTWLGAALLAFTALAIPGMEWVMRIFTHGFEDRPESMALAVAYGRILFSYLLCMGLGAHLGGVLNTLRIYAVPAFAPVLLNVFSVTALGLVLPRLAGRNDPVFAGHVLVWAVFASGFAQLALVWLAAWRHGMRIRPVLPRWSPGMTRLCVLMGPGVAAASVQQVNLFVATMIASSQQAALPALYFADRVNQLPIGMIGVAFGVVLLPELSRALRGGMEERAGSLFTRSVVFSLLLTLPVMAIMLVIPEETVRVLFERKQFGADSTRLTAQALSAYALGMPAYVLIKILQPAYFAQQNTRTPMLTAAATVGVDIALALSLFPLLGHVGVALAMSVAGWVNVLLLSRGLHGRFHLGRDGWRRLAMVVLACLVMAAALWAGRWLFGPWTAPGHPGWLRLTALLAWCAAAGGAYLAAVFGLRAMTLREFRDNLRR